MSAVQCERMGAEGWPGHTCSEWAHALIPSEEKVRAIDLASEAGSSAAERGQVTVVELAPTASAALEVTTAANAMYGRCYAKGAPCMREILRVLRVITRLNVGGPAVHASLLTTGLGTEFDTLLAAGKFRPGEGDMLALRPDLAATVADRLVSIPNLGRDPHPIGDLRALIELDRLVRRFRPHIVHTHTAKAGTLARLSAAVRRVPILVHTFHGTVFQGHFPSWIGRAIAWWENLLSRVTTQVLAVSPAIAADLESRGIARGQVKVIPLGLDLSSFEAVPALTGTPPPIATLVARLAPVKDVPLFFAAVERARRSIPSLHARVIGDGALRPELQRTAPAGVEFLGHRPDLPDLLTETGVVVLTSHSEGSPVALIEALTAARPVVSVPVGGVVDILRDRPGALILPDRSPHSVATGIVTALTDPSIATGAAAGRGDVAAAFGSERLLFDMRELYMELWHAYSRRHAQKPQPEYRDHGT